MVEEEPSVAPQALPVKVGEKLRSAREAQGLDLAQVAAETRISERHLEQIEEGDFGALPGRTYAVGFSRSYARLLGLDEGEVAREVRAELAMIEPDPSIRSPSFEPGDPGRVPSAKLAWLAALAGLLVFATGCYFFWSSFIAPAGSLPWLTRDAPPRTAAPAQVARPAAPPAMPDASAPVVFTALEDGIWVKFYDAEGKQLMQKQMALGETYTVPADADGPQIWTGRPDALSITVGGRSVPKLAENDQIMKDVPVTASALLARQTGAGDPSPTG